MRCADIGGCVSFAREVCSFLLRDGPDAIASLFCVSCWQTGGRVQIVLPVTATKAASGQVL